MKSDNKEWDKNREHMFLRVWGYKWRNDIVKEVDIKELRVYIFAPLCE